MTKEDLEKIDVFHLESKVYPNKFQISSYGEFNLHEPYRIDTIFSIIYNLGYERGVIVGKEEKANEIKKALNID